MRLWYSFKYYKKEKKKKKDLLFFVLSFFLFAFNFVFLRVKGVCVWVLKRVSRREKGEWDNNKERETSKPAIIVFWVKYVVQWKMSLLYNYNLMMYSFFGFPLNFPTLFHSLFKKKKSHFLRELVLLRLLSLEAS